MGTTLITMVGIIWFDDPATVMKIIAIGLIVAGVVGLNLQMEHEPQKPVIEPAETENAI